MLGTPAEENKKDEVLQQINDALEKENWGGNGKQVLVKLFFEGKFNVKIFYRKEFDKE